MWMFWEYTWRSGVRRAIRYLTHNLVSIQAETLSIPCSSSDICCMLRKQESLMAHLGCMQHLLTSSRHMTPILGVPFGSTSNAIACLPASWRSFRICMMQSSMCWWMELSKQGCGLLVVSNKGALFHLCFSLCTSMMLIA